VGGKLKPRFFGPYHVVELINEVVVRLELPPAPASTMCSMWGCSRSTRGRHPQSLHYCRSCIMAPLARNQSARCGTAWLAAYIRCSSSGRARRQHQHPGKTSRLSAPSSPNSSSRTSWLSTGREMSCSNKCTPGAIGPVDVRRAQERAAAHTASTQGTASISG
jgi:hypothetical protein